MKRKFVQLIPLLVVILAIAFWYLTLDCRVNQSTCQIGNFLSGITNWLMGPLYAYSLGFAAGAIVLVFSNPETFKKWFKFAIWWLPLSALLIAITPWTSGQWLPLFFIGKGLLAIILGGIMSVVTIFIALRNRKIYLGIAIVLAAVLATMLSEINF